MVKNKMSRFYASLCTLGQLKTDNDDDENDLYTEFTVRQFSS